ncbi:GNAT family N-acetyltransferase [Microtetraspora sp. NBRC 16547]|uniref:GNAT family N-acetyltransferase n=1 Tax=Microtetraspora sp. NBRC 16547 TaxID=3030993 RepID=UPI0025535BD1|nr:GNAT family N-acetyltransferase [Microtetraspora sp. NBRC 16547]
MKRRPPEPTQRLAFREMTPDDLDDMAALLGDSEVMRYYPRPMSRDEALRWIEWNQRGYREHGHGLWLITLRSSGEFVGNCGLTLQNIEGVIRTEVGYLVRAELQGNGYATEAAIACRDYARDVLKLDRLIAIINPDNVPSQRVAEKIGLTLECEAVYQDRPARIYASTL